MSDLVYFHKSKLDTLADKINKIVGDARLLSLDEMVDKCLTAVENEECRKYLENRDIYGFCFAYCESVPYFIINPKATNAASMFHYAKITELPNLDYSHLELIEKFCNGCSSLKEVISDTLKPKYCSEMFSNCTSLVKLYTLNLDKVVSINNQKNIFYNCKVLVEVRFVATTIHWSISFADSPLLSAESVQSIIDGLATVTTAQTVTFHKDIALTDAQKQAINEKGWTLVQ